MQRTRPRNTLAFRRSRPAEKPPAHSKYWQELMGQVDGRVRPPMLELTDAEKDATRRAFETCELKVPDASLTPSAA
jgi:4-hydroxy-tetrahydrodipicolinate synthase